jgi:hypothetical protein
MEVVSGIPFNVDEEKLIDQLKVERGGEDEAAFREFAGRARKAGNPRFICDACFVEEKGTDTVTFGGRTFRSRVLRANLETVERVFPYIVTCGREFDDLVPTDGDFLKAFWLDTLKEAALGAATNALFSFLARRHGIRKTSSMNPGSGPAGTWPIEQQKELFAVFGDVEGRIGVKLTDSFLMVPNKTISGIAFPTETDFVTCSLCPREECPNRRAPYDAGKAESFGQ